MIGTPEDAIVMIEKLQAHNWAEWEETKKSYELYARFVMPHFANSNRNRTSSYDGLAQAIDRLEPERQKGADAAFQKWTELTGEGGVRGAARRCCRGGLGRGFEEGDGVCRRS